MITIGVILKQTVAITKVLLANIMGRYDPMDVTKNMKTLRYEQQLTARRQQHDRTTTATARRQRQQTNDSTGWDDNSSNMTAARQINTGWDGNSETEGKAKK